MTTTTIAIAEVIILLCIFELLLSTIRLAWKEYYKDPFHKALYRIKTWFNSTSIGIWWFNKKQGITKISDEEFDSAQKKGTIILEK